MRLTFLGTGSAFCLNNYQSNMLLEANNGKKLLIDCGSDARHALRDLGYGHRDIDTVYVSHIHADHVGGLEWLGVVRKFDPNCGRTRLITHCSIIDDLWARSLSGGMRGIAGEPGTLEAFFDVDSLLEERFDWNGINFNLVKSLHLTNASYCLDSYGVSFQAEGKRILISSDAHMQDDVRVYQDHDVIFHDCETSPFKTNCHAHYGELKELPADIKSTMWLYHYQDGVLPDVEQDGFLGFVHKGQSFDL